MNFLFVRQLDWTSSVKELRGAVSRHVLELGVVEGCVARLATVAHAARAVSSFELLAIIVRKDFAVEESQVIWACTGEALVGI